MAFDQSTARPVTSSLGQEGAAPTKRNKVPFDPSTAKRVEEVQKPDTSRFEDFKRGMGHSVLKTTLGAYDLLGGDLSDTQKTAMEMMQQDVKASGGWGTAGGVVGEVAQLALPAGMLGKTLKTASKAKALAPVAGGLNSTKALLAGDALLTGGFEGVKLPDKGETRMSNAARGVKDALVGGVVAAPLRKAVTGIRRSGAADELMKMGVKLTPSQAADSVLPKGIEYGMQVLPFMAKGVQKAKDRSMHTWNRAMLNKASPIAKKVTKTGVEGLKQLKDNFDTAYKQAWNTAKKPSNDALVDIVDTTVTAGKNLDTGSQAVLKRTLSDLKRLSKASNPSAIGKQLDKTLTKKASAAGLKGDVDLADTLNTIKGKLRTSTGAVDALKKVDAQYGDWAAIRGGATAKKVLLEGGELMPSDLMTGVKKAASANRVATGQAPMYDFAKKSADVMQYQTSNPIIDWMKGYSIHTPTLVPLQAVGDTLIGNTAPQKLLQKGYNSGLAETLRNLGGRGGITMGQIVNEE